MSYQHFYSRVPARVSLYNKIDGFDTFAHSAALDREFILGELSAVYKGLLPLHDPVRIRRGEIPTVYSQLLLPSGKLVHTAVKYLPTDFTGERSAYFAHSLILNEDEISGVIRDPSTDTFNRDMFITDISLFRLTDRTVTSNPACPERAYLARPILDHRSGMAAYHPEMLKSFIYSVLSAVLEGGRPVYFRLPYPDAVVSEAAVDFINGIMSILPYSLRERLSFVSYVSEAESYPGFMLKGVGSSFGGVDPDKGLFYDFSTGIVTGMMPQGEKGVMISGFLYSLLEHNNIRVAFHEFTERIERKYSSLTIDVKTLKELSFMFWQCSGFYVENTVIPGDEAICRLFDIYNRYREGMIVEHRVQIYRCLSRYSEAQIAIPDSVFSRLSRLYPTECVEAKAVALDVLLSLIHVDLMRDSLFCFISRNYPRETEGVKAVIVANLSRVFYGGFLQNNILAFFDMYFRREPVHTRDVILDKLLLSIRTPAIQKHIVTFLDRHYVVLDSSQKMKVCTTCLEMIPECDELSILLVGLINRRIISEGGDLSTFMNNKLAEMLAAGLAVGDGRLASVLTTEAGYCQDIVLRHALNQWRGVETILAVFAELPGAVRADKLIRAYQLSEVIGRALYPALLSRFSGMVVSVWPSTLKEIFERDSVAEATLSPDVIELFRQMVIYPAVVFCIPQAFGTVEGGVGVDSVVAYAEKNPYIASTAEYGLILNYLTLVHKCDMGDTESAFKIAVALPESPELRASIAGYIKLNAYKPDTQDYETMATYELLMEYLSTGKLSIGALYSEYLEKIKEALTDEKNMKPKTAHRRGSAAAIELVISCASEISDASDSLAELVISEDSGLKSAIGQYLSSNGRSACSFLKKLSKDAYFEIEELIGELIDERKESYNPIGDAIGLIFKRKGSDEDDDDEDDEDEEI